jgi:hypothetical protein
MSVLIGTRWKGRRKEMNDERPEISCRIGDMSPDDRLDVIIQPDGDVIISVSGYRRSRSEFSQVEVEFCTIGAGGGRSPHTRAALVALAKAIERDNKENPLPRNP